MRGSPIGMPINCQYSRTGRKLKLPSSLLVTGFEGAASQYMVAALIGTPEALSEIRPMTSGVDQRCATHPLVRRAERVQNRIRARRIIFLPPIVRDVPRAGERRVSPCETLKMWSG